MYVAVVSLWLLLRSLLYGGKRNRWGLITGSILLLSSLVWFFLVTAYLENRGDGVMTYRYRNFMFSDSGSLLSVVAAVLLSPMKMIYECVDAEKLSFLAYTILPLAGMPFLTRRYERFVLLIPYILVNLMSDYQYQHDIFFQYTYGSTACLFYLTLVNLKDFFGCMGEKKSRSTLCSGVRGAVGFMCLLCRDRCAKGYLVSGEISQRSALLFASEQFLDKFRMTHLSLLRPFIRSRCHREPFCTM